MNTMLPSASFASVCLLLAMFAGTVSAHSTSYFTRPVGADSQEFLLCHWHGDLADANSAGSLSMEYTDATGNRIPFNRFADTFQNNVDLNDYQTNPAHGWSEQLTCAGQTNADCVSFQFTGLTESVTYTILAGDTVYLEEGCDEIFPRSFTFVPADTFYDNLGIEPPVSFAEAATIGDTACTSSDASQCSSFAGCYKNSSTAEVICTCRKGYEGDGATCSDIDECAIESMSDLCATNTFCENSDGSFACVCQPGYVGDPYAECVGDAWGIRTVFDMTGVVGRRALSETDRAVMRHQYAILVMGPSADILPNSSIVTGMPTSFGNYHYGTSLMEVLETDSGSEFTFIALFESKPDAEQAKAYLDQQSASYWVLMGAQRTILNGPKVYRWSNDPLQINPTGLSVDRVYFETSCLNTGCWKVDVTYTAGIDNFMVFYLPKTDGDDTLSYDQPYDEVDGDWTISPEDTFEPAKHPCTSSDYEALTDPSATPASVTACCIPAFLDMYRPVQTFPDAISSSLNTALGVCGTGSRARGVTRSTLPVIASNSQTVDESNGIFQRPIAPAIANVSGELFQSEQNGVFVQGTFSGMTVSNIYHTETSDMYIGIYKATLELDEVELRTMAGILKGTVGVEHTVDTFIGLAEFSPTGTYVIDPFVRQVNLHLEKTSFFTVSSHGTNDYTFLQYVNMRLVAIYLEDKDFSGADESTDRTVRTDKANAAHYVQVTFTLGAQYDVNTNSGLIPLDSVRAGEGAFLDEAPLQHKCMQWATSAGDVSSSYSFDGYSTFASRLGQTSCAPAATMCSSPASIPDSFVSFNIPLGIDFYDPPSASLSNNIFVDMVISAVDTVQMGDAAADAPNDGGAAWQMKTTLSASIPVVEGGVNIFCDGLTSKTDLKDVVDVDIVVGSAEDGSELARLPIKANIASTQLNDPNLITEINSDSIESGLMTLVIKGNSTYFATNTGRTQVSVELEDVITLHVMEADGTGEDASVVTGTGGIFELLAMPADDNSNAGGLDTDGYALNGAFFFTIHRASLRAHLEPSDLLRALCPFSPTPPSAGSSPLETCVMRRDVRYREYPWKVGAKSTAMEICTAGAGACATDPTSDESKFFVTILGDSDYARGLALSYASTLSTNYTLNGRFRRAYWINPGYEWTPTQTGGTSIFSLSQKLFLFALVTLDEGLAGSSGNSLPNGPGPNVRRRMLLQSTPDALQDGQSSVSGEAFSFKTSPQALLANTFEVPEDRVASFQVSMQLSQQEACSSPTELQASLRSTMEDYLSGAASAFHTVQVTSITVDQGSVQCARRSIRSTVRSLLALSDATATATVLVVFEAGTASTISLAKMRTMAGVQSIEPLTVSPKIDTEPVEAEEYTPPAKEKAAGEKESAEESSDSNLPIIIGAVAGVVGLVAVAGGVFLYMKSTAQSIQAAEPIQTVSLDQLKVQLQQDA
eukprot:CAMPEP_0181309238 /NCGR_PEP_ID=MMETSP1101-20121128/11908_1 /TAXON_ID=46948 /ORGANISM="Rhodomonas abbreviata, Strain Caron Lab Isolate" /LENGTH=1439 /DNA_ID=CAMNT_0023415711 /DNA_START=17 /DNA_END=4336 /DNA_ORIENTATION=+